MFGFGGVGVCVVGFFLFFFFMWSVCSFSCFGVLLHVL